MTRAEGLAMLDRIHGAWVAEAARSAPIDPETADLYLRASWAAGLIPREYAGQRVTVLLGRPIEPASIAVYVPGGTADG